MEEMNWSPAWNPVRPAPYIPGAGPAIAGVQDETLFISPSVLNFRPSPVIHRYRPHGRDIMAALRSCSVVLSRLHYYIERLCSFIEDGQKDAERLQKHIQSSYRTTLELKRCTEHGEIPLSEADELVGDALEQFCKDSEDLEQQIKPLTKGHLQPRALICLLSTEEVRGFIYKFKAYERVITEVLNIYKISRTVHDINPNQAPYYTTYSYVDNRVDNSIWSH